MRLLPLAVALLMLASIPATVAQEGNTLYYETSVQPETYTFESGKFQTDENGERIRNEDGSFVPVRQFVTLTVEASFTCSVPPSGERLYLFVEGLTVSKTDQVTGETRRYLALEPGNVSVEWTQETALGDWTANGTFEIEIISESKPDNTLNGTYRWYHEDMNFPEACPRESLESIDFDVHPHEIIIPGFDLNDDDDTEPGDEGTPGTPAPGPVSVLAAVGLAVALRRRV